MEQPDHLLRSYRKYKAQEKSLLRWICETASLSGHRIQHKQRTKKDSQVADTASKVLKPPNLKGRARTLARRVAAEVAEVAETQDVEQKEDGVQNDYEPPNAIYDILAPVTAIVRNSSITKVPGKVADQLRSAYNLRKNRVSWYKANTSQHDTAIRHRNANHAFPVAVLKEAINMFKNKFPAGFKQSELAKPAANSNTSSSRTNNAKIATSTLPSSSKEESISNVFGYLSIEELEDPAHAAQEVTTDTVPVAPSLQSTNTSQVPALTEVDRRLDECILAKYCLYEDLQEIEDAIVLELVRYSLDQANADVLAFLMNTSIEFVADMCTAFNQSFKDCLEHRGALFKATFAPTDMNWTALDRYPQSRMEFILTISLQVLTRTGKLDLPPGLDKQFDPDCDYFELHGHDQYIVDTSFVAGMLTSKKPQCDSDISGSFAVDLMSSAIELFEGPAFAGVFHFPPLNVALRHSSSFTFRHHPQECRAVLVQRNVRHSFGGHRKRGQAFHFLGDHGVQVNTHWHRVVNHPEDCL